MAADVRADNEPYDDINITPMLDLAYVLLVTFIILTTASVQGIKVHAPRTSAANQLAKPQTRAVTITREGALYLDAYPVTLDELARRLAAYKSANPALPVVLKADARTAYQKVTEVLEVAKKLEITEIGLVTQRAGADNDAEAAMHVQNDTKPYDTINVTPMLDLAYVLLVVFILMTTASVQGLTITLPKPSNQPTTEHHELLLVQVAADGALLLNGAALSLAEIEQRLTQARRADPKVTVAIKGDAAAAYEQVVRVIDLCNRLAVDMALVTSRIGT